MSLTPEPEAVLLTDRLRLAGLRIEEGEGLHAIWTDARRGRAVSSAGIVDLSVGGTGEVFVDGPVAQSGPVQGYAAALVRVGR